MKYLGIARAQKGSVKMPDTYQAEDGCEYEAVELGGDIILTPSKTIVERHRVIQGLTEASIHDHRSTLEKLA
jgi:hypothetical protein